MHLITPPGGALGRGKYQRSWKKSWRPDRRRRQAVLVAVAVILSLAGLAHPSQAAAETDDRPVVYLTFDDGPNANTDRYLALLAAFDARATFFVLGRTVASNPAGAQRIVDGGHAIANHTWDHPALASQSSASITSQFARGSRAILDATGVAASCYRPPYGSTSRRVHDVAVSLGLTNSGWTSSYRSNISPNAGGWDIDTSDYRGNANVISRNLNRIRGGEVVLMHDIHAYSLAPLRSWLVNNAHRFRFEPLPGCGAQGVEPDLDPADPEAWYRFQVARLYIAYFNRFPDAGGWEFWNTQFVNGTSLRSVSGSFADSDEFARTYGASVADADFVEMVYENVLGRRSDGAGKAFWLDRLQTGTSRGELMVYFSESPEFRATAGPSLTGDCWSEDVSRSYACAAPLTPGLVQPESVVSPPMLRLG